MQDFMTVDEVAEFLRTPRGTLAQWRYYGKGPSSFKLGRRVLYTRAAVEDFVAAAQSAGNGPDAA